MDEGLMQKNLYAEYERRMIEDEEQQIASAYEQYQQAQLGQAPNLYPNNIVEECDDHNQNHNQDQSEEKIEIDQEELSQKAYEVKTDEENKIKNEESNMTLEEIPEIKEENNKGGPEISPEVTQPIQVNDK